MFSKIIAITLLGCAITLARADTTHWNEFAIPGKGRMSVSVIYPEKNSGILVAAQDSADDRQTILSYDKRGLLNWSMHPSDGSGDLANTTLSDAGVLGDARSGYLACMHHTASKENPDNFSTLIVLNKTGAITESKKIVLDKNGYKKYSRIKKCKNNKDGYLLFGIAAADTPSGPDGGPLHHYWLRQTDIKFIASNDFVIPSDLGYIANIVEVITSAESTLVVGTSTTQTELSLIGADGKLIARRLLAGDGKLIHHGDSIEIASVTGHKISRYKLDFKLNMTSENSISIPEDALVVAVFSNSSSGLDIFTTKNIDDETRLYLTNLSSQTRFGRSTLIKKWHGQVFFSPVQKKDNHGNYLLSKTELVLDQPPRIVNSLVKFK
jgi:hypothetical protein